MQTWAENVFEQGRKPFHANVAQPSSQEAERFRATVRTMKPDAVILNYAYLAPLSKVVHEFSLPAAVLTHDVVHQMQATMLDRGLGKAAMNANAEAEMLKEADLLVAIQDDEAKELKRPRAQFRSHHHSVAATDRSP
ncbi:MAG: hypothetical protein WDN00_08485 [Limisphaerales bacterium]